MTGLRIAFRHRASSNDETDRLKCDLFRNETLFLEIAINLKVLSSIYHFEATYWKISSGENKEIMQQRS